jgi:Fe-S-cluster containining protein
MLEVYATAEKEAYEWLKKSNITPSCKRGCDHCCHMMTAITHLEAKALAKAVLKLPGEGWKEVATRCRTLSLWLVEHNSRDEYFATKQACPVLDSEKRECLVYGSRPAACRFYMVVSDPDLCSPDRPKEFVKAIDLSRVEVSLLDYSMRRPGFYMAPLPLAVLFALTKLGLTGANQKYIEALTEDLSSPEEWFNNSSYRQWTKEDSGTELQNAHLRAAVEMWGPIGETLRDL